MLLRRNRAATADPAYDDDPDVIVEPGTSLAKGPALLAGSILVVFGLAGLLKNSTFPSFSSSFPDGTVQGTNFLGIEVNGWTDFFAIAAGALLMFGAAQHHLAKFMSLLVGLALAACAVIAIIDGQDVLGLAAANTWTKVGFAVAGGAMLLNAMMPRTTRRRRVEHVRDDRVVEDRAPARRAPVATDQPTTVREPADAAPTTAGQPATAAAPTTTGQAAAAAPTTTGQSAAADAPTTTHRRGRFFRGRDRAAVTTDDADRTTIADPPPRA